MVNQNRFGGVFEKLRVRVGNGTGLGEFGIEPFSVWFHVNPFEPIRWIQIRTAASNGGK
jgi:hypothetical protein